MQNKTRGRLFALVAASALIAVPAYGQSNQSIGALQMASPEQVQAYQTAVQEGPAALISFMRAFPSSPLIPQVIAALGGQIGAEAAIQAALDAGVPRKPCWQSPLTSPQGFSRRRGRLGAAATK